jgi:hypothetical protein
MEETLDNMGEDIEEIIEIIDNWRETYIGDIN